MELNPNYIPPTDAEIEAMQDFDDILQRHYAYKKRQKKLANWTLAASVVLILSIGTTFAYFYTDLFKQNTEIERVTEKVTTPSFTIFDTLKLAPQWFKIDNSEMQFIETKAGIGLVFDKNSFKNTKSILVNISEVTDSTLLKTYFLKSQIAFFITFFDADSKKLIENTKPINLQIANKSVLYFNSDISLKNKWVKIENKETKLEKLDKSTLDYVEYAQAKSVLDSINLHNQNTKIIINFSKEYISKLTKFVADYEMNKDFKTKSKLALQNLTHYNEQRTITVNKQISALNKISIDKKGWWALK